MILIFASIYDLAIQARGVISWALRHPDLPAFPVSGLTPRATSLQILSCACCYEQSVHALSPQGMDAGTPLPQGIQASLLCGARPRKLMTRATAMRTHPVGSTRQCLLRVNLRGSLAKSDSTNTYTPLTGSLHFHYSTVTSKCYHLQHKWLPVSTVYPRRGEREGLKHRHLLRSKALDASDELWRGEKSP